MGIDKIEYLRKCKESSLGNVLNELLYMVSYYFSILFREKGTGLMNLLHLNLLIVCTYMFFFLSPNVGTLVILT